MMFPNFFEAKHKDGITVPPQIRKYLAQKQLEESMSHLDKKGWQVFRRTVQGFLGDHAMEDHVMVALN